MAVKLRIDKLIACSKPQLNPLFSFCSYSLLQTNWSIFFHSHMKTTQVHTGLNSSFANIFARKQP